ncbi:uncharacterized protein E0L32_002965 [Thyridium curvatum]|uniref:Zn(2)-C6 fungal-type domain-containing protein n=1 Tax=Thyridium curvatum TaxID=1093900 RepID=A0A507BGG2_9PEZI|nr:uncharacterized protein E0L32_002965 [Thyridium curvatum]TPX17864.1 hypothetical protein E0L32_002965 [Thyridium curvatum]
MRKLRYSASRQKSCQQCSIAKAKCDRNRERCSRCVERNVPCVYPAVSSPLRRNDSTTSPAPPAPGSSPATPNQLFAHNATLPTSIDEVALGNNSDRPMSDDTSVTFSPPIFAEHISPKAPTSSGHPPERPETVDFSLVRLICPIDAEQISNRWLNTYVPAPGQRVKVYPTGTTVFLRSILHSYASMSASGRNYPPFVHSVQTAGTAAKAPLSTCLSLVRACERPLPGSEDAVLDLLKGQMSAIVDGYSTYDQPTLTAAFQAYLIYCLMLYFIFETESKSFLRQAIVNIQMLASSSAKQGLMCVAEMQHSRPSWEEWIIAESKRRSLYTMYLLDSLLLIEDGLTPFLGIELQGLLAPARRSLWDAQDRHTWERAYNRHLADWPDAHFRIDELWNLAPGADVATRDERIRRIRLWLEDVDNYGTMMYSITSAAHGI